MSWITDEINGAIIETLSNNAISDRIHARGGISRAAANEAARHLCWFVNEMSDEGGALLWEGNTASAFTEYSDFVAAANDNHDIAVALAAVVDKDNGGGSWDTDELAELISSEMDNGGGFYGRLLVAEHYDAPDTLVLVDYDAL